jgi:hypothetical protein
MPSSPKSFLPQHHSVPSARVAQVCSNVAEMLAQPPAAGQRGYRRARQGPGCRRPGRRARLAREFRVPLRIIGNSPFRSR